jgi:hypothetical protein
VEQPKLPLRLARERLRVGWERPAAVVHELRPLSARQQAEVGEGFEPYNPDWDRYFAFDRAGSCAVWTARTIKSGILVGFVVWILTRGLHCSDTVFANADLVYLAPDYREGLTGYRLLKTAVAAVRSHVDFCRVETNMMYEHGRMGVLLKRLGFRKISEVWQSG